MDRTITAASTSASTSSSKTVTQRRKTSAGSLWTFSMPSLSIPFRKGSADTASTSESSIFDAARKPSDATTTTVPDDDDKERHPSYRRSVTFSIPDTDDEDEPPAASNSPPPTNLKPPKPPSSASSTSRTPTVQLITTFSPTNIYLLPPLPSFHTPPLLIRSLHPLLPPPHLPGPLPDSLDPSQAPIAFTLTNNALYAYSPASNTSRKRPASILSTVSKKTPTDPPLATFALPWSINKPTSLTLPHVPTAPSLYLHTDMFDKRGLQWADPVSPALSSLPADDTPSAQYSCRRTKQPGEWVVQKELHGAGRYVVAVIRREEVGWGVWVDERGLGGVVAVVVAGVLERRERQRGWVGGGTI